MGESVMTASQDYRMPPGIWEPCALSPGSGPSQLTEVVRDFADTLDQFKDALHVEADVPVDQELLQERLEAMLMALQLVIDRYPSLNHNNSLLETAASVVDMVHGLSDQAEGNEKPRHYSDIFRELDALEISFGNSTVDFFMMEAEDSFISSDPSPDEEITVNEDFYSECRQDMIKERNTFQTNEEEADKMLMRCERGVESSLLYAKLWAKYTKELLSWMERRTSVEIEFSKSMLRMAEMTKNSINQEKFMPFQYIYMMALQHDIQHGQRTIESRNSLQHNKYIQPLTWRRNELEKQRREFKEQWQREQRKMNDALTALRKSKQMYHQRCEDFEKAKLQSAKAEEEQYSMNVSGTTPGSASKQLEKRRRSKDEAQMKVQEAEIYYRNCVVEANSKRKELETMKVRIITQLRKLIDQGDLILKEVSVNLFQMQEEQIEQVPLAFRSLHENIKLYEPGQKYFEFIQNLDKKMQPVEFYEFEEFATRSRRSSNLLHRSSASSGDLPSLSDEFENKLMFRNAVGTKPALSDSESTGGSSESRSLDSPMASPAHFGRKLPKTMSSVISPDEFEERDLIRSNDSDLTDLINETSGTTGRFKKISLSKAAQTHRLRKLRAPTKCRECEGLIVVNGAECEQCYLACHRKCLESVAIMCGHRKLQNKVSLFGVDFAQVPREAADEVPFIIRKCIAEIDSRALNVQGLYRVNGSKIRISKLRHSFENGWDLINMSENSPHDITNVLTLYLRELPESIVLSTLYNDFMNFAKELHLACEELKDSQAKGVSMPADKVAQLIQQAKALLQKLPAANYNALEHIIGHLYRVTEQCEENKMSSNSLGIIFGPTLIRPPALEDTASMTSLVSCGYQAQIIDFLITQCNQIFEPKQDLKTWPTEMPANQEKAALGTAKGRSNSSESLVLKRNSSEGYVSDKSSSNEALDDTRDQRRESSGSSDMTAAGLVEATRQVAEDSHSLDGQDWESDGSAEPMLPRCNFSRQPGKYQRYGQAKSRAIIPKPSALPIITAGLPSALTGEKENTRAVPDSGVVVAAAADTERRVSSSSRSSSPDSGTLRRSGGKHKRFEMTVGTARLVSKLQDRRRVDSSEADNEGEKSSLEQPEAADAPDPLGELEDEQRQHQHTVNAELNSNQSNNVCQELVDGQREKRRDIERMLYVSRQRQSTEEREVHFV
ncbi:GEM-interacting protein-like isoform X1 [Chiloscyllium plagiosum]|uniref:GEM-interacting protein-like isoform X1 n=2 Tax=Chiloscyllium plagiosum TaxID=36176 RepID=UPI001CB8497C|nr:GEM-interacting protein-like isoform X1 [Chiloscyllium plagiosum]